MSYTRERQKWVPAQNPIIYYISTSSRIAARCRPSLPTKNNAQIGYPTYAKPPWAGVTTQGKKKTHPSIPKFPDPSSNFLL